MDSERESDVNPLGFTVAAGDVHDAQAVSTDGA